MRVVVRQLQPPVARRWRHDEAMVMEGRELAVR
jgi:hypothetical protein